MSKLSEEEILEHIEDLKDWLGACKLRQTVYVANPEAYKEVIQGLLDLYNKEKEKNKELEERLEEIELQILEDENY